MSKSNAGVENLGARYRFSRAARLGSAKRHRTPHDASCDASAGTKPQTPAAWSTAKVAAFAETRAAAAGAAIKGGKDHHVAKKV